MKVVIVRKGSSSFITRNKEYLLINVATGDDIIEVFRWINLEFINRKRA